MDIELAGPDSPSGGSLINEVCSLLKEVSEENTAFNWTPYFELKNHIWAFVNEDVICFKQYGVVKQTMSHKKFLDIYKKN